MTARTGMGTLIARWRRMVADSAGSVWSDDEAQQILDTYRTDVWAQELTPVPQHDSGSMVYKVFVAGWENIETVASGTAVFRMYDASGSAVGTTAYSADYQRGIFAFTADQQGSARYIDARSFDLNMAAADGWRELMASKASLYRFTADGASYDRNQWFEHCRQMALHYDSQSKPAYTHLVRGDVA